MILKYKWEIVGLMAGAVAGWCYWYFVGCSSGSCPISSSPYISTVYGSVVGVLAAGAFSKKN